MSINEIDITILDFIVKQDRGTLTKEDWSKMDKIKKNNKNWSKFKETMKIV